MGPFNETELFVERHFTCPSWQAYGASQGSSNAAIRRYSGLPETRERNLGLGIKCERIR